MASTLQICALLKPWATIPVSSRLHGSQQENKKWTERHGCVTSGTFRHQWKASRLGYWIKAVFASNAWFSIILELWKMNPLTWHERGTKKISESPTGIETMTSRTHGGRSITELREFMESKFISLSSHVTGVLHTAGTSTVEFIVSSDRWMQMVNFELGNQMWRMNYSTWHERGTKNIILVPDRNRTFRHHWACY